MEFVRVPENPKDKEWNPYEYRRTLILGDGIRGSTGEPDGERIESHGVPENPKDKEWNPCEYRRTLIVRNGIRGSTGEPDG